MRVLKWHQWNCLHDSPPHSQHHWHFFASAVGDPCTDSPLPPIPQLVSEVREHQWQFDKERENYTYTSLQTTEDIDANGRVQKTETVENQEFFVNSHVIERTVKKNGSPLNDHDQQREAERVSALVEKAKRTPPDQQLVLYATNISRLPEIITRVLGIMDVRNPRREIWHYRPTIVFDFVGRRDAKTHGFVPYG